MPCHTVSPACMAFALGLLSSLVCLIDCADGSTYGNSTNARVLAAAPHKVNHTQQMLEDASQKMKLHSEQFSGRMKNDQVANSSLKIQRETKQKPLVSDAERVAALSKAREEALAVAAKSAQLAAEREARLYYKMQAWEQSLANVQAAEQAKKWSSANAEAGKRISQEAVKLASTTADEVFVKTIKEMSEASLQKARTITKMRRLAYERAQKAQRQRAEQIAFAQQKGMQLGASLEKRFHQREIQQLMTEAQSREQMTVAAANQRYRAELNAAVQAMQKKAKIQVEDAIKAAEIKAQQERQIAETHIRGEMAAALHASQHQAEIDALVVGKQHRTQLGAVVREAQYQAQAAWAANQAARNAISQTAIQVANDAAYRAARQVASQVAGQSTATATSQATGNTAITQPLYPSPLKLPIPVVPATDPHQFSIDAIELPASIRPSAAQVAPCPPCANTPHQEAVGSGSNTLVKEVSPGAEFKKSSTRCAC